MTFGLHVIIMAAVIGMSTARKLATRSPTLARATRVWSKVALSMGTKEGERRDEEPVMLQMPTVSRAERLARLRARLAKVDVDAIRQRGSLAN